MQIVYQLRRNQKFIDQVQKATLTTKEFGIQQTHGLFGSLEWWENIQTGNLKTHFVRGVIHRVYMGSQNDWPMCEMLSDDGEISKWTREMQDFSSDSLYRIGAKIEIDYVLQKSKPDAPSSAGAEQKNVLEIRIEDAL
jgi:trehalose utilization protein